MVGVDDGAYNIHMNIIHNTLCVQIYIEYYACAEHISYCNNVPIRSLSAARLESLTVINSVGSAGY